MRLGSQAVAMARRLGDKAVLAEVLNNTVVVRSDPAQLEEQLAASREAVALADEVGAAIPRAESRVWLVAHLMAAAKWRQPTTSTSASRRWLTSCGSRISSGSRRSSVR